MKKPILQVLLALVFGIAPVAEGKLSTRVCRADGNTPLEPINITPALIEYPDIMVGTKLTIIVSSDVGGNWGSDLTIEGNYRDYGLLSGRDYNDLTGDYEGSRFEAAGWGALVLDWLEEGIQGFNLEGHTSAVQGDWFIIDYTATDVEECRVGFYDRSISWSDPNYYLAFFHVRTRDFNKDTKVDFSDFAVFASHWQETGCNDPNWCQGTDLDTNESVDFNDLMLFADYWLEKTE
jgi:hypothetical protein